MEWKENLARNIKNLRRSLGYKSQDTFSEKVGCSKSMIRDIEAKKAKPSMEMLEKIASTLETSVGYLLSNHSVKEPSELVKDPNLEALERLTRSFGYSVDITNWDDYTLEEIEQIHKFDLDVANCNSWERAEDLLDSYDATDFWIGSLTKVRNSLYAIYRFLFFYDMFHPKRSVRPCTHPNFPRDYPDWLKSFDVGFVQREFFYNKDTIGKFQDDLLYRKIPKWDTDFLLKVKEKLDKEIKERSERAELERLKGKGTA